MCPLGTKRVGALSAPTIGLQVWNISGTVQLGWLQTSCQPLAIGIQQHMVEGERLIQLHLAVGGDDHHPLVAGAAGPVAQKGKRAAVGPVGIFQGQQ